MKHLYNKITWFLTQFDGLWSFPAGAAVYVFSGMLLFWLFGPGVGSYDPGFIQPFLLAVTIVAGAATATNIGLWFNFRAIYRYLYGREKFNSKEDIKTLQPWQSIGFTLLVYFFYFFSIILVYLKFV